MVNGRNQGIVLFSEQCENRRVRGSGKQYAREQSSVPMDHQLCAASDLMNGKQKIENSEAQ